MEAPPRRLLPIDILLEIAARSEDAATIVRCAAVSKPLRRGILEPTFRRRLANIAAAKAGRAPALATALYQIQIHPSVPITIETSRPGFHRFNTSLLLSSQPVCSRDGLLVLWMKGKFRVEFYVCDTFTGSVTDVPTDLDSCWRVRSAYCPAMLITNNGGAAGQSFKLLVLHRYWRTQTFSSRTGRWGAVRGVKSPIGRRRTTPMTTDGESLTSPVVIGRTVHWLCNNGGERLDKFILALHADTKQATVIKLPQVCNNDFTPPNPFKNFILAATADGRLGVVVPGHQAISMWTLSPEEGLDSSSASWSLHLVIDRQATAGLLPYTAVRFEWFGERTGTVLLVMDRVGLVQIDLRTKEATVLHNTSVARACLHEIDVLSFLDEMKSF